MAAATGTFTIGSDNGDRLAIRTSREGLAARVGHDLTIEAATWSGEVVVDPDDSGRNTVRAVIELDSLRVREGLGGKLPLTDHERDEIDDNIHGVLGRSTATYVSTRVAQESADAVAVDGTLTLNGMTRPVRLVAKSADGRRFDGRATVTQTEFGIKPYTAFLGALKLRDAVEIEVSVTFTPPR
jgi:polyisoprenoid-binding protein YceI